MFKKPIELFKGLWRLWKKVAHFIGKVNTTILLTLFYIVILGIAKAVSLCLRKDILDTRWKDRSSYWKKRERKVISEEGFLNPY